VGGGGDDTIVSGEGNDVVQGGLGSDAIDTAGGDDEVRVRDGAADQVACGVGADRAQIDGGDRVADCESVEGVAAAEGAPEPGSSPATPEAQPPAPDTVAPRLRAGGLTRQRLGRRGFVRVAATVTEAAELYATGYAEISGVRHALGRTRADVTFGGGGAELRIKLDPPALRAARRALRRKRRALVVISVLATDRAGNSTPVTLPRILLQR
jgi:Ca2+-binding RTX toxin-like protein